ITAWNKADLEPPEGHERAAEVGADVAMSVAEGEGVDAALDAVVEAIGYEPKLPFEGS
ncbi:MAG: GTP-binding protein, partial [Actinobacteria bacterium]|nr:GTP-binding protein [Actinomycetota bacterium]